MSETDSVQLVVGWDGRAPSAAALMFAVDLARRLDAHVHVVHIIDMDDVPVDPDSPDWERQVSETLTGERDRADRILAGSTVDWTYHLAHGFAADQLIKVADQYHALMIIVGRPRGGAASALDSLFRRSVSRQLIGTQKTPLVLVPG